MRRAARVADRPRPRSRSRPAVAAALGAAPPDGPPAKRAAVGRAAHCVALIDAAGPACVAVKPQLAGFERLGADGWAALRATVEHARAAGLLVLADGKRGDITSPPPRMRRRSSVSRRRRSATSTASARTLSRPTRCSASTRCAVRRPRPRRSPGSSCSCGPPTPGAADVEDLELAAGDTVWERIAGIVAEFGRAARGGGLADVGAVVGATAPEHVARMRELMPRAPFLLPGIGAQGGRVEDLAPAFAPGKGGGLVSASRSIAAHESGGRPPAAARAPRPSGFARRHGR